MDDTSPKAREIQIGIYQRMTGAQRLALALDMSDTLRRLALARLRQEHPDWTEWELKRELLRYAFLTSDGPRVELPPLLR